MNRKNFLRKGLTGIGAMVVMPGLLSACNNDDGSAIIEENDGDTDDDNAPTDCSVSPSETDGPYPIKSPSSYVRTDIIGDRTGVALKMTFTIIDKSNGCTPLEDVMVDIWHCDKEGNYSQYGSYTSANFLRGRQTTNTNGEVTFTSIFPGWYRGRAPHIHLEVLTAAGQSLLVTQIAFPVDVYTTVYNSSGYNGAPDTSNTQDDIFADSLSGNMVDEITGSVTSGYQLSKKITVA